MVELDTDKEVFKLQELGFLHPRFFNQDHWAAVIQNGSFPLIVDGNRAALSVGYCSRWVYRSLKDAYAALEKWDGQGEPQNYLVADRNVRGYVVWP